MRSLREIGEMLKNAREKKALTFDKVYKKTHIYPGILRDMENGRTENVNKIYAKAFLKKYAAFLGLDADLLAREYDRLFHEVQEEPKQSLFVNKEEERLSSENKADYIRIGLSALVVIIFIVFSFRTVSNIRTFLANRPLKKAKELAPAVVIKQKKKEAVVTAAPKPEAVAVTPKSSKISLSLRSLDKVWVSVKRDGETIFSGTLSKGSHETWECKERFEIRAGKLDALDFTVNNKYLGKIGSGVKDIVIDKEGVKIGGKKARSR